MRIAGLRRSLIIAALSCIAASPLPGLGTADPRHGIDLGGQPWRGLIRVQTEAGGRCTGFLLTQHLVITAAHCLWSDRLAGMVPPRTIHLLLRYDRGSWAAQAVARDVAIAPAYDRSREMATAGADRAVLTLATPIGDPGDTLGFATAIPAIGTPAMLGGYDQDRAEIVDADTECRILGVVRDAGDRPMLRHSCAGTRGTSGAPLLVRDAAGQWRVAGVQVMAGAGQGGIAALMHDGSP